MFTPRNVAILALALSGGMAFAQENAEDAPRTSAELPEELPETGERAPAAPPASSAEQVENVDPSSGDFGIGHPVEDSEIAAVDIDLMPGGEGQLVGSGNYAQGEEVYATMCAACHGENLEGVSELGAPKLIGGRGTLASAAPVKTVESYWPYASTLVDYVHRAMPMNAPGSLSFDDVYAVSAYILGRAGIVAKDFELSPETIDQVSMPNADGFVEDPRPDPK